MPIAPFKLERYFARYEFSARYLLGSSDCETFSTEEILALEPDAMEAYLKLRLGYTESLGHPALRAEIARQYETIAPDQVLTHAGAGEAIFNFMQVALTPADHAIVHWPCYQSLEAVARALGADVTRWETREEEDWVVDLSVLRKSIRPNTRAVVVNCPHNPTGYLMDKATQRDLIALCRQHNLLLFSDEVYRGLERHPADTLPPACDLYENAVSLGVMSKVYGLAGLRLGWIATRNAEIFRQMAGFKDYTSICNSAPSEFLATLALRHGSTLLERNLGIIRHNLALLDGFFGRYPDVFRWKAPKASAIAFPGLRLDRDIEAFCDDLVETQGVMLLPGTVYDAGNRNFRLGYGRKNLPEALDQLETYLQKKVKSFV